MNSLFAGGDIWIEITKIKQEHNIPGWEFGTCLWIPSKNRSGHDRYSLLRKPKKGDLVLHFYKNNWEEGTFETRLCGSSIVASPYVETTMGPSTSSQWSESNTYYKIALQNYEGFEIPISMSNVIRYYGTEIRYEINEYKPKYYPFSTYGDSVRIVQGIYLAKCTSSLYILLKNIVKLKELGGKNKNNDIFTYDSNKEYIEGLRSAKERYFFSRNRNLVNDAKKYYGYTCCICGFNFEEKYGVLGKKFIECHHINPLSERSDLEWSEELQTKLEDVRVVCSNCHRMIHSKRPALKIEDLIKVLR